VPNKSLQIKNIPTELMMLMSLASVFMLSTVSCHDYQGKTVINSPIEFAFNSTSHRNLSIQMGPIAGKEQKVEV
jgi:hypothetical protein